jgi:hypothetical protein
MAKQLITFVPVFTPGAANAGTLDFRAMEPRFELDKLYAVINVTRNQLLYVPGGTGLGLVVTNEQPASVITLELDTSSYSSTDDLNVIYEVATGLVGSAGGNLPREYGGMLEMQLIMQQKMLIELMVLNTLVQEMTNNNGHEDLTQLREDFALQVDFDTLQN